MVEPGAQAMPELYSSASPCPFVKFRTGCRAVANCGSWAGWLCARICAPDHVPQCVLACLVDCPKSPAGFGTTVQIGLPLTLKHL